MFTNGHILSRLSGYPKKRQHCSITNICLLKNGGSFYFSHCTLLSINCNSVEIWGVHLPIWCPIESILKLTFTLLLVATIDLEFIYFSLTYCEHFQTRKSREKSVMNSHIPITPLLILPVELDLVCVCLVVCWFRESRKSLESPFPASSLKRGEVITTD